MIYYMAKRPDGELEPRFVSEIWINPGVPGWNVVPVEIREYSKKRAKLERAAGELMDALRQISDLQNYEYEPIDAFDMAMAIARDAITKAEGK